MNLHQLKIGSHYIDWKPTKRNRYVHALCHVDVICLESV